MATAVELRSSVFVHAAGQSYISLPASKYSSQHPFLLQSVIVTGGPDGEVAVHEIADSDTHHLKTITHKRIHRGAITGLLALDEFTVLTVGEDGALFSTERPSAHLLTSRTLYRASLPLRHVAAAAAKTAVAVCGDEMAVVVLHPESFEVQWSSKVQKNPLAALCWCNPSLLVSIDCAGVVRTWQQSGAEYVEGSLLDLRIQLSKNIKVIKYDQQLLVCCQDQGLFFIDYQEMKMIDHFRPPNSSEFCVGLLSACNVVCLVHSEGLTLLDPRTREASADCPLPAKNVVGVCASLYDPIFLVASLTKPPTIRAPAPALPSTSQSNPALPSLPAGKKQGKNPLGIFDSEEEDGDEGGGEYKRRNDKGKSGERRKQKSSKNATSRDKRPLIDDEVSDEGEEGEEEELGDYDVASESASQAPSEAKYPETVPSTATAYLPEYIHKAAQPACTPWVHGYRYLCWNATGVVTSRQDDGYSSVEVEFHDQLFHRPIRFIDEVGYSMASVSSAGAIFAAPQRESLQEPSSIHFVPLDSWAKISPWNLPLPPDEEALGRFAVVATDQGFLRTVSSNNIQGPIVNYPGKFVTMAAREHTLFLIHADEFNSELGCVFYNIDTLAIIYCGPVGGRFRNTRILWAGLYRNNVAAIFDENYVLHVSNPSAGYVWQPWLECQEQREREESVWPVSFTMHELACVIVRAPEEFPEVIPRPLLTMLPLRIPLLNMRDPLVASLERALGANQILKNSILKDREWTEKEVKKMQIAADKHVLELIQLAIKSDKPARVLELCGLFLLEKSWEMAVQLAKHNRQIQLADRIEALRDTVAVPAASAGESETAALPVHKQKTRVPTTPRLSAKLASESPGTILANLTPLGNGDERLARARGAAMVVAMGADAQENAPSSPTPLKRPASVDPPGASSTSALASLANPFARITLDSQKADADPQSFAEMVKSVQREGATTSAASSTLESTGAKKTRTAETDPLESHPQPQQKTKKQSSMQLFAKKTDAEAGSVGGMENVEGGDNR